MFVKSKIRSYLLKVGENKSPFDVLLSDYLNGKLKREFQNEKIRVISIRIDWSNDNKCILVRGKYQAYHIDVEIYPSELTNSYDYCNNESMTYPLDSSEQVYSNLLGVIKMIHIKYSW